jgi:hypothetical protein
VWGQLQFAPAAVFTSLFRPLIFEVNNPQSLLNALETTALLLTTGWLVLRKRPSWMLGTVMSNPTLAFSVAFTLPLALGVGLISNNLGTLSRYRCPLVPFFVLVMVMLVRARGSELLRRSPRRIAIAPDAARTAARLPAPNRAPTLAIVGGPSAHRVRPIT